MLELKQIKKDYPAGDGIVHALKGVDIQFRENEFVSILGPSGCGKTTLLNIIGGLDQYTEGDLIINGKSTKDFKDRDWDSYRNHSIGFVFQSYNLIPHQTVLQNVEIALTLSGVSKAERRARAKKALEDVGLGNQLHKKPNQMSGGQMQRVAIARALVNNPDIILADEPTGALDTETSVQVMDILKEISKDRLIIMVTHNPEIAEKYSTRIIKVLDGLITSDSSPITEEELKEYRKKDEESNNSGKYKKKPSMSWFTSFGLSLKNLFSKKGRTILTSFAGSIGIIGIALIFSVSQGLTTYIDTVQEDTLSSYPLTIEETTIDIATLLETFMGVAESDYSHENDAVYSKPMMYELINALNNLEATENDLKSFKEYIESEQKKENSTLAQALNGVQYTYNLDLLVYTENIDGTIMYSDTQEILTQIISEYFGMDMSAMMNMSDSSGIMSMMSGGGMMGTGAVLWQEMLSGKDGSMINPVLEEQYDMIYGSWPTAYNEVVLVVDENNELDDMTLYALGLKSKEEMDAVISAVLYETDLEVKEGKWSYEEICDMTFKVVLNSSCYSYDEVTGTYKDLRETEAGLRYLYNNGIDIKVSGIIRPNEEAVSTMLTGSIGYTYKLTEYVIEQSTDSEAVQAQQNDKTIDIFTGLPFNENTGNLSDKEKTEEFKAYIESLDDSGKAKAYIKIKSVISPEDLQGLVGTEMAKYTIDDMKMTIAKVFVEQMGMNEEQATTSVSQMKEEDISLLFSQILAEQIKMMAVADAEAKLGAMEEAQLVGLLDSEMKEYSEKECASYYDAVLEFSESTYEDNLTILGCIDLDKPASISLYASSFENKDVIEEVIADYNEDVDELSKISYTDYVGIMMSSITSIINAITYVLIAFVAISLVVSSIMIGVITLISVQERTKEIGILRAIGASKKNVSGMFNAETVIIGFTSGLLGVLVTYILCIPINIIIKHLTGIAGLEAYLPIPVAIILIAISIILTLFAGIIPSRSAAKKDPVVALRTE